MVRFHIAVTALLLGILHRGLGEETEEAGVEAKQMVISGPINNVQQSWFIPNQYYEPNPYPVTYYAPHLHPPPPPRRPRTQSTDRKLLLALLYYSGAFRPKAATMPQTIECIYQAWGTCSANCQGTRTRLATCNGVLRTESSDCNTQLGFLSNGWYRASNCYDYLLSREDGDYDDAKTGCNNLGGTVAQVGMRDEAVRREVVLALHTTGQPVFAYIGLDKIDSTDFEWLDGSVTVPDFWTVGEPDTSDCVILVSGNPESARDAGCTDTSYHYYCERQAT